MILQAQFVPLSPIGAKNWHYSKGWHNPIRTNLLHTSLSEKTPYRPHPLPLELLCSRIGFYTHFYTYDTLQLKHLHAIPFHIHL